jgi:hypothetical protein
VFSALSNKNKFVAIVLKVKGNEENLLSPKQSRQINGTGHPFLSVMKLFGELD